MKLIDQLFAIHIESLDTFELRHKYGNFQYLGYRLYKFYHYAHQACAGEVFNDASEIAMICAYVLGSIDVQERQKSKFSIADIMLQSDICFYNLLWGLISQKYTNIAVPALNPPLLKSLDTDDYNIITKDYIMDKFNLLSSYCELNGIKIEEPLILLKKLTRTERTTNRNLWSTSEPEFLLGSRVLYLMFACLENDINKFPEPYPNFWYSIANDLWLSHLQKNKHKLHLGLRFRKGYLDGNRLYPQYHKN